MRLIDADALPVSKVGKIPIVLLEEINNAKTIKPKVIKIKVVPDRMIDIKWLQKKMMDAITSDIYSDEHLDSKYFGIINEFIAEWEREQDALGRGE